MRESGAGHIVKRGFSAACGLGLALICAFPPDADASDRTRFDWPKVARDDLNAAYRLLRDNHPAAVVLLGDLEFRHTLRSARQEGLAQAASVVDETAYRRLLSRFVARFGDPHIGFRRWPPVSRSPETSSRGAALTNDGDRVVIRLPALNGDGARVVDDAGRRVQRLAGAGQILIDLRGNRGGDSAIGDRLVRLLFPATDPAALVAVAEPNCPIAWRASPGNAAAIEVLAHKLAETSDMRAEMLVMEARLLRRAHARGQAFAMALPARCLNRHKSPLPRAPISDRIRVLTDGACFSSCLILVERLRFQGAKQVGTATAAGNWYMDVRAQPLPSGLGDITMPQKVDLRRSQRIGPFVPDPS
ncbi:S41 family peptidase [Sphingomonas qomolangmaensis]|uniref:S41 family peptidase n=1 Tax=Sphingomonas qomolangmaensis TaxID=2918765 RepID=A0ABY5LAM7_9SPHN|nr:S41 family peptidase [Sphingomonas qomolangmaensis]UUL84020.1 S41 family peptidase [Sphingomonas qomolangmaensis]